MKVSKSAKRWMMIAGGGLATAAILGTLGYTMWKNRQLADNNSQAAKTILSSEAETQKWKDQFEALSNSDQVRRADQAEAETTKIAGGYDLMANIYEAIDDDRNMGGKIAADETKAVGIWKLLADKDFDNAKTEAEALLAELTKIKQQIAAVKPTVNLTVSNSPPGSGMQRQTVHTDAGDFWVDIISADLKTNKVVVDTVSDSTCTNNCPVTNLAALAVRSGAWAAVNGPYFCPASYPQCVNKTNSFDTLLMNKNKVYFNSDNNVYSTVPAAIFSTTSRFVDQSLEWGRDTGVDSVIAGQPLLVYNSQIKFFGNSDSKESIKSNRAFIGANGETVYIGVVHNVTVAEEAKVVAAMNINNAINLDDGGSLAFWQNGKYIDGPGRDLPFGILLVKR